MKRNTISHFLSHNPPPPKRRNYCKSLGSHNANAVDNEWASQSRFLLLIVYILHVWTLLEKGTFDVKNLSDVCVCLFIWCKLMLCISRFRGIPKCVYSIWCWGHLFADRHRCGDDEGVRYVCKSVRVDYKVFYSKALEPYCYIEWP